MPAPAPDPWLSARDPYSCVLNPTPIVVYKVNDSDSAGPGTAMTPLPGIECLNVKWPAGLDPKTATLRYRLSDPGNGPHSIEDALATGSTAAGVLTPNDRIAVLAFRPDGSSIPIFDGWPVRFNGQLQGDEQGGSEDVYLSCVGVERRAQDTPMPGMFCRDANTPDVASDVQTHLPAVFNPRGQPNATPLGADHTSDAGDPYPTFLGPDLDRDSGDATTWTLPRAAAYLLYHHNDETHVSSPERSILDTVLVARLPRDDGTPFNPNDPAAYDARDINAPNTPITGRDWPKTLENMLAGKGFLATYRLTGGGAFGVPRTVLDISYWQAGDPRVILLQARGSDLDGTLSNIGGCDLTRDVNEAVTAIEVRGHAHRWQATFVLECGFPMSPSDAADAAAIEQWSTTASGGQPGDNYRLYVFGETGDGYYRPTTGTRITDVPSLDPLFGPPDARGNRQYAIRRRPGSNKLLAAPTAPPETAILEYSTDYGGAAPAIYGTPGATGGAWYPIQGGFRVLDDRLGVRLTVNNPNELLVGRISGEAVVLKGVEAQAVGAPANPSFHLRLTTWIEADDSVLGQAAPRDTAAINRTVTRQIDARDRYFLDRLYVPSGAPGVFRDDTEAATDEAIAHRDALDAGQLEGTVTIPYFTAPPSYDIGHRITAIYGRNLGLRTDGGSATDYPTYPIVRAIEWHFTEARQETILTISDSADGEVTRSRSKPRPSGSMAHDLPADRERSPLVRGILERRARRWAAQ